MAPPRRRLRGRVGRDPRDPEQLRRFVSFVNAPDAPDPTLAYVRERGQRRPATAAERAAGGTASGPVLIASTTLEVRS